MAGNSDKVAAKAAYIACGRFGGQKPAPACLAYDRYHTCRRTCKSLEDLIKAEPDLVDRVKKSPPKLGTGRFSSKLAFKGLPDSKLRCRHCQFVAKSERGLKSHCTRSHKRKP